MGPLRTSIAGACLAIATSLALAVDVSPVSAQSPSATSPTSTTPAAPSGPVVVDVPGIVSELEAEGPSGLRMAVARDVGDEAEAVIDHVDASGVRTASEPLIAVQFPGYVVNAAFAPRGGAALLVGETKDRDGLYVSTRTGARIKLERIDGGRRHALLLTPLVVGPTGAAAVGWYEERPRQRTVLKMAFRPAGARHFRAPVEVRPPVVGAEAMVIALGPDGGGAVFSLPDMDLVRRPSVVRRISATGRVGPGIRLPVDLPIGTVWRTRVRAGFGPDGTLMAALVAEGWDRADRDRSASWFVTLGPHATKPTRVQRLAVDGTAFGSDPTLALRVDRGGRVTVVADLPGGAGTGLYEGTARGLRRVPGFQAKNAASTALGAFASGRGVVVWNRTTTGRGPSLLASTQRKTRDYSPGIRLLGSPTVPEEVAEVTAVAGLDDGRLATSWRAAGDTLARNRSFVLMAPLPRP